MYGTTTCTTVLFKIERQFQRYCVQLMIILFIVVIVEHSSYYGFFIELSIDGDIQYIFHSKDLFIVSHCYR